MISAPSQPLSRNYLNVTPTNYASPSQALSPPPKKRANKQPNAYIPPTLQFTKYGAIFGVLKGIIESVIIGATLIAARKKPGHKLEIPAGLTSAALALPPITNAAKWAFGATLLGYLANGFLVKTPQQ